MTGKCCIGSPIAGGPFCIPRNATCCSDTLCEDRETCCGEYCCRSVSPLPTPSNNANHPLTYHAQKGTSCSTDRQSPGCCPLGKSCSTNTPPTCIDHFSPACSAASPQKQCCPASLEFCSSKGLKGFGCYASATVSATKIISIQTAAQTSKSLSQAATTAYRGTTTIIETVSIKVVSPTGISLVFPTLSLKSEWSGWSVSTSYVFSFPSTIFGMPPSSSSPLSASSNGILKSSSASNSSPSSPSSSLPTKSPLCINPHNQTPEPCTSTLSSSTSSTTTTISTPTALLPTPSTYPTERILHSSAPRLNLTPYHLIASAILTLYLGIEMGVPFTPVIGFLGSFIGILFTPVECWGLMDVEGVKRKVGGNEIRGVEMHGRVCAEGKGYGRGGWMEGRE